MSQDKRIVLCQDAEQYLITKNSLPSVITSLPDKEETNFNLEEWKEWFIKMCVLIFTKLNNNGYAIFYQTDRKIDGGIIDKSYLVNKAACMYGIKQIAHKIVLKQKPETISLFRPSFTHFLVYSKNGKAIKIPDVFYAGKMIYKNAMGFNACEYACKIIKNNNINTIVDPFCGQGSVLAIANSFGLNAIGIDILQEQCELSKKLIINNKLI
jgi:hypothetical protein